MEYTVEHATGKASKTLIVLKRNIHINNVKIKTTVYTSLARPIKDYGTTACRDPHTNKNITKL